LGLIDHSQKLASQRAGTEATRSSHSFTGSGTQKVTLTDAANGTVVTDGLKLVRSYAGDTDNEKEEKSGGTVVASHDLEYDPNGNRSKDTFNLRVSVGSDQPG
jgi:hypothetical protein